VQRSLPGLTRGEAVWWTRPSADQPVTGRGSYADGFDNRAR
jgi:ribosomal protection tetracycline resistance protein